MAAHLMAFCSGSGKQDVAPQPTYKAGTKPKGKEVEIQLLAAGFDPDWRNDSGQIIGLNFLSLFYVILAVIPSITQLTIPSPQLEEANVPPVRM